MRKGGGEVLVGGSSITGGSNAMAAILGQSSKNRERGWGVIKVRHVEEMISLRNESARYFSPMRGLSILYA